MNCNSLSVLKERRSSSLSLQNFLVLVVLGPTPEILIDAENARGPLKCGTMLQFMTFGEAAYDF